MSRQVERFVRNARLMPHRWRLALALWLAVSAPLLPVVVLSHRAWVVPLAAAIGLAIIAIVARMAKRRFMKKRIRSKELPRFWRDPAEDDRFTERLVEMTAKRVSGNDELLKWVEERLLIPRRSVHPLASGLLVGIVLAVTNQLIGLFIKSLDQAHAPMRLVVAFLVLFGVMATWMTLMVAGSALSTANPDAPVLEIVRRARSRIATRAKQSPLMYGVAPCLDRSLRLQNRRIQDEPKREAWNWPKAPTAAHPRGEDPVADEADKPAGQLPDGAESHKA